MKKVYYAHSISIYNTPQEKRDIELLESLGFEVINPNTSEVQEGYQTWKAGAADFMTSGFEMTFFDKLMSTCDIVAFRAFPDLKIGSGIVYEVNYAITHGKPVFELATLTKSRNLDVEETREYLKLLGQR